jgi:Zn finger protein HypA/HybF involved in hydrogenase expression
MHLESTKGGDTGICETKGKVKKWCSVCRDYVKVFPQITSCPNCKGSLTHNWART